MTPHTTAEVADVFRAELIRVAPDADLAGLDPDADLGETLDLDSMDFLNLVIALNQRLGITVPESDYSRVRTLRGATEYLAGKLAA